MKAHHRTISKESIEAALRQVPTNPDTSPQITARGLPDRRRKIDKAGIAEILRRRTAGETLQSIGESLGVTRQRIDQIIRTTIRFPTGRAEPKDMTEEQLSWLSKKLKTLTPRNNRRITQDEVREIVRDKYGFIPSIRSHRGTLSRMNVAIGIQSHMNSHVISKELKEYIDSPLAAEIREREKAWAIRYAAEAHLHRPKRGRPKKVQPTDGNPSIPAKPGKPR